MKVINIHETRKAELILEEQKKTLLYNFIIKVKDSLMEDLIIDNKSLFDPKTCEIINKIESSMYELIDNYCDNYQNTGFQNGVKEKKGEKWKIFLRSKNTQLLKRW